MAKKLVITVTDNGDFQTADIIRKDTYAYRLAKMLSDGRRKNGATRKEIVAKLGGDPSPYIKMYACFVAIERGRYVYVGSNLADIK